MTKNEVSTLKKGLLILDYVTAGSGVSLSDVITAQNLSKSTDFRMLSTLENMHYLKNL